MVCFLWTKKPKQANTFYEVMFWFWAWAECVCVRAVRILCVTVAARTHCRLLLQLLPPLTAAAAATASLLIFYATCGATAEQGCQPIQNTYKNNFKKQKAKKVCFCKNCF